jgi:pimeloyl-ACP methyl ester carboxylesterase
LHGFLAQPSEQTHDALWQHCARDLPRLRAGMGELWQPFAAYNVDRARVPGGQKALAELMQHLGAPSLPEADLARIAVPTTLIWGRYDLATPLSIAEAASSRYGWPLHVIEDANDDPPIEQPEAVVRALRASLAAEPAPEVLR